VTANFTPIATVQVHVGTTPAGLSFTVDSVIYSSAQTFTWNIGSNHTVATTSPQTVSGTQNVFASWSDGGALSHSVTAAAGTTSYTATFNTSYQLTTASSPTAGGTVTPASGTYYAAGTVVPLTATANSGYTFSKWTGPVASSSSQSTTVTMNGAVSIIGNFVGESAEVTVAPAAAEYSDIVYLEARVACSRNVFSGTMQFYVNGLPVGSPVPVSAPGVFTKEYQITEAAGSYPITVQFTEKAATVTATNTLSVRTEEAVVTPAPSNPHEVKIPRKNGTTGPITLVATVRQVGPDPGDISNAVPVTVALTPVGPGTPMVVTASTKGGGVGGVLTASGTFDNVPAGAYVVSFKVGGNYYSGEGYSKLVCTD
jgi:hypothetical protein